MENDKLLPFYPDMRSASFNDLYISNFKRAVGIRLLSDTAFPSEVLPFLKKSESLKSVNVRDTDVLVKASKFYGAGYKDAALRYRGLFDGKSKIAYSRLTSSGAVETVFVHTRGTVMFFASFITLLVVAVVFSVAGLYLASIILGQVSIFSLSGSMIAGMTWLRRAEVERERFRSV